MRALKLIKVDLTLLVPMDFEIHVLLLQTYLQNCKGYKRHSQQRLSWA